MEKLNTLGYFDFDNYCAVTENEMKTRELPIWGLEVLQNDYERLKGRVDERDRHLNRLVDEAITTGEDYVSA